VTTTISKVTNRGYDEANAALLRKYCQIAADAGGNFSIVTTYDGVNTGAMIMTFTINWPEGVLGEKL
jgi:hypothetical protein